jgi:hypothetical protein
MSDERLLLMIARGYLRIDFEPLSKGDECPKTIQRGQQEVGHGTQGYMFQKMRMRSAA